ncbi:MAG: hypothetical protein R3C53_03505 [Pirellulaceae bacterium]
MVTVLEANKAPMTAKEIYDSINSKQLYEFKAKDPFAILRAQLNKHCVENQSKVGVTFARGSQLLKARRRKFQRYLFKIFGPNEASAVQDTQNQDAIGFGFIEDEESFLNNRASSSWTQMLDQFSCMGMQRNELKAFVKVIGYRVSIKRTLLLHSNVVPYFRKIALSEGGESYPWHQL